MILTLTRTRASKDGVFGELTADLLSVCTLEHAYPAGDTWITKIPPGEYRCVRGLHRLAGMAQPFETFEVLGVEGHKNLLFHTGNFNRDSEGCILLGESANSSMILNSRRAFATFLAVTSEVDEFTLQVVEAYDHEKQQAA